MSTAPVTCLGVGHLSVDPAWSMHTHRHDFVEMMAILGGNLATRIGDQEVLARPGDVLCYPAGTPHSERVQGRARTDFIFFAYRGEPPAARFVAHDASGRMRLLAGWLFEEQSSTYARKQQVLDALLRSLLAEFAKAATHGSDTLVERVRAFLKDHLNESLTVRDLAALVDLSPAHFIRTYKRLTQRTPMQDLRMLRLEAARDLLITTALPLKAIAPRVGFCDEYHLSRVFRRCLGVSPGYFRKRK
jgi:AraC-like DNA-binding protein